MKLPIFAKKSNQKIAVFIVAVLSVALLAVDLNPKVNVDEVYEETLEGSVRSIEDAQSQESFYGEEIYQKLSIEVTKGSLKGEMITVENGIVPTLQDKAYEVGDRLVIIRSFNLQDEDTFIIADTVRRPTLYLLFALFIGMVLMVTQGQGLRALLGMVFSFFILFRLVLPLILAGFPPVWMTILGCVFMIPVMFYLSHGWKHKTTVAIGGTLLSLVVTGILASLFAEWGDLSGLADDAATFLKADTGNRINFQGLLLAGIIISMLGVLDDVSISQASLTEELRGTKENISFFELYSRAMRVGKDHIASMVNTLVLVYTGASLPLLLLFINHFHSFSEVLNYEFVAEEIIQTLVASIGLILTVPLTTFLACVHSKKA